MPQGQKRRSLRALELWDAYPTLGLADALVAAAVEQQSIPLATFDRDFARPPRLTLWQPPSEEAT